LKIVTVVGGVGFVPQERALARGADVLVATPGRLMDLISRKALRLDLTHFLVLDEADQMMDLGFIVPLKRVAALHRARAAPVS
jgi:ATP-dependent RNA helicase RhlE